MCLVCMSEGLTLEMGLSPAATAPPPPPPPLPVVADEDVWGRPPASSASSSSVLKEGRIRNESERKIGLSFSLGGDWTEEKAESASKQS